VRVHRIIHMIYIIRPRHCVTRVMSQRYHWMRESSQVKDIISLFSSSCDVCMYFDLCITCLDTLLIGEEGKKDNNDSVIISYSNNTRGGGAYATLCTSLLVLIIIISNQ
jgi:hypothetical protein